MHNDAKQILSQLFDGSGTFETTQNFLYRRTREDNFCDDSALLDDCVENISALATWRLEDLLYILQLLNPTVIKNHVAFKNTIADAINNGSWQGAVIFIGLVILPMTLKLTDINIPSETIFQILNQESLIENPLVHYLLGQMQLRGLGIEKNKHQAISHIQYAADHGSIDALIVLMKYHPSHPPESLTTLHRAVSLGHAQAQVMRARHKMTGYFWGIPAKSVQEFIPTADLGHCSSGDPEKDNTAFLLLKNAGDQGHKNAQIALGGLYKNGIGTAQNLNMAAYYYSLAKKQGAFNSIMGLNEICLLLLGQSCDDAQPYFDHLKQLNQIKLGKMLRNGLQTEEPNNIRVRYASKLAELQSQIAMLSYLEQAGGFVSHSLDTLWDKINTLDAEIVTISPSLKSQAIDAPPVLGKRSAPDAAARSSSSTPPLKRRKTQPGQSDFWGNQTTNLFAHCYNQQIRSLRHQVVTLREALSKETSSASSSTSSPSPNSSPTLAQ